MTTVPPQRHIETALSAVVCAMLLLWLSSLIVARAQWSESDLQDMLTAASLPVASGAAPATISDPHSAFLVSLYYHGITNTTSWVDSVAASGNNMTNKPNIATGPAYTAGATTYPVWTFDNSDDYFINYSQAGITTLTKGTVMAWVNFKTLANTDRICNWGREVSGDTYGRFAVNSGGQLSAGVLTDATAQWAITMTAAVVTNSWILCALVHDGTSPSIYTNGVKTAVTTNTSTSLTKWMKAMFTDATVKANYQSIGIERYGNTSYNQLDGKISELRVYSTNITDFSWYITNTHPTNNLEQNAGY